MVANALWHEPLRRAAELIRQSRRVIALAGAGMSVDSGIPTFRGPGGLWQRVGEPSDDDFRDFLEDPEAWLQRRMTPGGAESEMLQGLLNAQPNAGHRALAKLEAEGIVQFLVTQNVDDLHARAGSRQLAEIHGNIAKTRCLDCGSRQPFDIASGQAWPLGTCPSCGGTMKTDAVLFGEPIPADVMTRCEQEVARSDCMLLLGTSAGVFPAAGLPLALRKKGGRLIEINPYVTDISSDCEVVIRASTTDALPALVSMLVGE